MDGRVAFDEGVAEEAEVDYRKVKIIARFKTPTTVELGGFRCFMLDLVVGDVGEH